ncbi:MAG: response regulator transcription factor [Acidimicrobiales bacterium]
MTETADTDAPITLAIVNDYGVVLAGINAMLAPHADRIRVLELDANMPVSQPVDLVLYDTFARTEPNLGEIRSRGQSVRQTGRRVQLVVRPRTGGAGILTGAAGYVSKTSSADELVDALERLHAGERFISPHPARRLHNEALEWPGRSAGLTAREAEVLALITQGKSNAAIADLLHLSVNTIKGNIRSAYAKIGASNRVDAVLWGTAHGMQPDQASLTRWE